MKRSILVLLMVLLMASPLWAVGTASVTSRESIRVLNAPQRMVLTITWVDDTNGTTLALNPATYDITGWYLYSALTNPGDTAPTDGYDITLVDADGVDIAGGMLMNRDQTNTELVNIGVGSHGYPVIRGTFTFTLSGNSVNGGEGTCILTFVAN